MFNNFFTKIVFLMLIFIFLTFTVYADDEAFEYDLTYDNISEVISASSSINEIPVINARHAIILDRASKQIIYGKKETEQCKMASTTKIMTAIIVLENSNLYDTVVVSSKSAGTGGSRLGLSTNDKLSVESLLYGLMLRSGNDAAVALAEHVAGTVSDFSVLMNNKAKELGLNSTNFVTPHGLDDDNHFTTAFDLALLTDYALKNEVFAKIVNTKNITISLNGYPKTISNTNELLGILNGVYGVKTGFTNGANRCLVTSCKRGDLDIICVVLGCDTKKDRTQDSVKLINYVFSNFSLVNVEDIIYKDFNDWYLSYSNCFTINKGISQNLDLYLDKDDFIFSHIAVNNTDINNISTNISFTSYYDAPISCNTLVGTITLSINSSEYFSIDILNSNEVVKKNVFDYFCYLLMNYSSFFDNNKAPF